MKKELFDELVESIRESGEIRRGGRLPSRAFVADGPNIKRIRTSYDLSNLQQCWGSAPGLFAIGSRAVAHLKDRPGCYCR